MTTTRLFLPLIIAAASIAASAAVSAASGECVYTLYVKTGSILKAGTDSRISVTLGDADGGSVCVGDLEAWGLMGRDYDYYERGALDAFSGRGPCIGGPICSLNLTSDGSGKHHGWYCDYVEVTSTGPHRSCGQSVFYVDQWLADDAPPYQLTALVDGCSFSRRSPGVQPGRFVVGYRNQNQVRSASH